MKKEFHNEILLSEDKSIIIEYYITQTEVSDENFNPQKKYGIEVLKKQILFGNTYREIKRIDNMFEDPLQAKVVLDILHRNSVTPIAVSDVMEDISSMKV